MTFSEAQAKITDQTLQWGHSDNAVDDPILCSSSIFGLGFNGATATTLWMTPASRNPAASGPRCFNGATATTLWMTRVQGEEYTVKGLLQWGHSDNAVDDCRS